MNTSLLASSHCVGVGRRFFLQLRSTLEREVGVQTAAYLQEAGFAGGAELYAAYAAWLSETYQLADPGDLDQEFLSEVPAERFKTPLKAADIPRLFTPETFCKVVVRAQRTAQAAA